MWGTCTKLPVSRVCIFKKKKPLPSRGEGLRTSDSSTRLTSHLRNLHGFGHLPVTVTFNLPTPQYTPMRYPRYQILQQSPLGCQRGRRLWEPKLTWESKSTNTGQGAVGKPVIARILKGGLKGRLVILPAWFYKSISVDEQSWICSPSPRNILSID